MEIFMEVDILYRGGTAEIVEKKSRFIANVFPVQTPEEALAYIEQMKKKYYDARHNCFAYVIGPNHEWMRSSDDGEPSGTAGHPMLDILTGAGVHNALVVITRYFGGTLLGTGGLVRAYSEAAKRGLENSVVVTKKSGKKMSIRTDYNGIGKLQYLIAMLELTELECEYGEGVNIVLLVPEGKEEKLIAEVTEATSGKAVFEERGVVQYGNIDGKIVFLE